MISHREKLLIYINRGIDIGENGFSEGMIADCLLGYIFLELSITVVDHTSLFSDKEVKEKTKELINKLGERIKTDLIPDKEWGWFILKNALLPGQSLYPDKTKHPWWWWYENWMTPADLKKFNKYLKDR
jgi:hypothetical protein